MKEDELVKEHTFVKEVRQDYRPIFRDKKFARL